MFKKFFLFLLLFICYVTHAETCPTPSDIQSNHLKSWRAFDINNGTPVSNETLFQFEKEVDRFALAEWMQDAPEGYAHCYYLGISSSEYLSVYLVNSHLFADGSAINWHWISQDTLQCTKGIDECRFVWED